MLSKSKASSGFGVVFEFLEIPLGSSVISGLQINEKEKIRH